eukprot:GHVT01001155.1.p1 GENE.GHVT01001155.1~~GHVT01001155.1.p1  ORF type:complete len:601 (-),score=144.20 GHVT01001155.1:920-2722(-)
MDSAPSAPVNSPPGQPTRPFSCAASTPVAGLPRSPSPLRNSSTHAPQTDDRATPRGCGALPALKISFYETVTRQLVDDGFLDGARVLARLLGVRANSLIPADYLFSLYSKFWATSPFLVADLAAAGPPPAAVAVPAADLCKLLAIALHAQQSKEGSCLNAPDDPDDPAGSTKEATRTPLDLTPDFSAKLHRLSSLASTAEGLVFCGSDSLGISNAFSNAAATPAGSASPLGAPAGRYDGALVSPLTASPCSPFRPAGALHGEYSSLLQGAGPPALSAELPALPPWLPVKTKPVPPLREGEGYFSLERGAKTNAQRGQRKAFKTSILAEMTQPGAVFSTALSSDGRMLASGGADGHVRVATVELEPLKLRNAPYIPFRVYGDHTAAVAAVAFHPRRNLLYSGSPDCTVKVFDVGKAKRGGNASGATATFTDAFPVRSLLVHPCGDFVYVGTSHPSLRLYDCRTLVCYSALKPSCHHSAGVNDIDAASDGTVVATASDDGQVHIWDVVSGRAINKLYNAHQGAPVESVRWSRLGRHLLTSGGDGQTRLWDMRKGKELVVMGFGDRSTVSSTAVFLEEEEYIAAVQVAGTVSYFKASPRWKAA